MATDQDIALAFFMRVLPDVGPYGARFPFSKKSRAIGRLEYAPTLEGLRDKLFSNLWCDCYFSTGSLRDMSGQEASNVAYKKAFYADFDIEPTKASIGDVVARCMDLDIPWPGIVKSGGGFHAWWPLDKEIDVVTWLPYANGLKEALKGLPGFDETVTADAARILRCPGTINYKRGTPVPVKEYDGFFEIGPYSLDQFKSLLAFLPCYDETIIPVPQSDTPREPHNEHTAEYYGSMLDAVPKPETYSAALQIGMALHSLGWGEPAFDLWVEWYDGSPEAQSASGLERHELAKKWATFCDNRENKITPATLVMHAEEHGWTPPLPKPAPEVTIDLSVFRGEVDLEEPYAAWCKEVLAGAPGGWLRSKQGCVLKNEYHNAKVGIVTTGVKARFNRLTGCIELSLPWSSGDPWQRKTDALTIDIQDNIMRKAEMSDQSEHVVNRAISHLANKCAFNPLQRWLRAQEWDGRERLDTWLWAYCGAEDTPLNRYFGSAVLIAAVRRALADHFVPFDHMLVLIGRQGSGKSTIVRTLGLGDYPEGGYYRAQPIVWSDPRSPVEVLRGCWFYEWADLAGHTRADENRVKSLLSSSSDSARLAYRRDPEEYVRRTIFVATTNEFEFIKDQTGARRYWPVQTGENKFRLEEFKADIAQIYAEAIEREKTFGPYFDVPAHLEAQARAAQEARTELPRLYDALSGVTGTSTKDNAEFIYIKEIKDIHLSQLNPLQVSDKDIHYAMKRLGWLPARRSNGRGFMRRERYCDASL